MRVKVRAVIVRDGKLVVSRERRRGREHLLLPGGRVQEGESITAALVRELSEETGLDVIPVRLLYVAEVVGTHNVHDLNLIWLGQLRDQGVAIDPQMLLDLDSPMAHAVMPPIVEQIAADAEGGWPPEPRWLGNIRRSALD